MSLSPAEPALDRLIRLNTGRRRIIEVAGNRVLKCGVVIHVCENEAVAHAYAESLIDDLRYEAERGR